MERVMELGLIELENDEISFIEQKDNNNNSKELMAQSIFEDFTLLQQDYLYESQPIW